MTQLATQATVGVAQISEAVHQSVLATLRIPGSAAGGTRGITGAVYGGIRGAAQLVGRGVDIALAGLVPLPVAGAPADAESPRREALLAALNGVMGDRLAADGNPLATPMSLRRGGRALHEQTLPQQMPRRVLLLVHGLCMNDLQWHAAAPATGHTRPLASTLGAEPIYVRYNSGLHISQNGRELALQLERLLARWPGGIDSISVLAHSMGGLVVRSALHQASTENMRWPQHLQHIVFIGTPHHGAPLERAGTWVDLLLRSSAYSAPFGRLAQLRSAGITDLRHGLLLDADWQGRDRFERRDDAHTPVPLPARVACFAIAASTASKPRVLAGRVLGDGLVPLPSALGQHGDARRSLVFADDALQVFHKMNHMQLLHHPDVTRQLQHWLANARG